MNRLRGTALALLAPLLAIVFSLIVTSIVIEISGDSSSDFLGIIFAVPTDRAIVNIVNQTALIFLAAIAAAIGFRMNLFNIGVEGQIRMGAYFGALFAGAALLPGWLNVAGAVVVAALAGAVWAGIAALLKVTRGVSEVISTIMLNSIAVTLIGYFINTHGVKAGDSRRTAVIPESSQLKGFTPFESSAGSIWTLGILAVVVGVGFWFVLNRTRFGFDLRASGESESAAKASGVNHKRMTVAALLLSGAIAGIVWLPSLFGSAHYYGTTFQSGLGFTGIAVALLGRNRAVGVAFGALLFAFLNEQSNSLTLDAGISVEVIQITQGVIVLAVVIAYELVRRYRLRAEERQVAQTVAPKTEEVPA